MKNNLSSSISVLLLISLFLIVSFGAATVEIQADTTANSIIKSIPRTNGVLLHKIEVPGFCKSGLCKVRLVWSNTSIGMVEEGFSWPVTLRQSAGGGWKSGPAMTLGGYSVTVGNGVNGNGSGEAVVGGGQSPSGNSLSLYDDYDGVESSPDKWVLKVDNTAETDRFRNVKVYVSRIPARTAASSECVHTDFSTDNLSTAIDVPEFCRSGLCTLRFAFDGANIGLLESGFSWPVTLKQYPDNSWISGPGMVLGGYYTTSGKGTNGNSFGEKVIGGGETSSGSTIRMLDDSSSVETSPGKWSFFLDNGSAEAQIENPDLYVCPLHSQVVATNRSEGGLFQFDVPDFCQSGLCEIRVSWDEAPAGLLMSGLSWPVFLRQNPDGNWISGPNLILGGYEVTEGGGTNGDGKSEEVIGGGESGSGNSFTLYDDFNGVEETKDKWVLEVDNSANEGKFLNMKVHFSFIDSLTCRDIPYVVSRWDPQTYKLNPDDDPTIDLAEIFTAIFWWSQSRRVPNTCGKVINLPTILGLIEDWAQSEPIK